MAVLSDPDRQVIWSEFMEEISNLREPVDLTKSDLRATFNALDDYFESQQAAINQTIPLPARTNLTAKQKSSIARLVLRKRYEVM